MDAILEKGKGPRLKKLRMLEVIEADLQLAMRTHLGSRMGERAQSDDRMSKHDHGSRKVNSTANTLLEKRLVVDNTKKRERQVPILYQILKRAMTDRHQNFTV